MASIYKALNGEHWKTKWDIESGGGVIPLNASHCHWHGILCDNATKHVLAINMPRNNLKGDFYADLEKMEFLLGLCLGVNSISGKFEKIIANIPKNILRLSLAYNDIHGSIPERLSNYAPILSKLQLSGCRVSGNIPKSIGDLQNLTVLSIGETKIQGWIPQSVSKLTNLWFLDLEALALNGDISVFENLNKLSFLHLSSNKLKGTIPRDIGQRYPELVELLLQNNQLSGPLPRSIGLLNKLVTLNVARNNLTGFLPIQLSHLNLEVLILSSNKFAGFEPGPKFAFKALNIFMASNIKSFNCSIRQVLSLILPARKTLMQIDISHSNIFGQLPDLVFSFKRLTFLKLASNQLTGPVPSPVDNLPYLTMVDVRNNNLSGSIPVSFSRLLTLTELHAQGNRHLKGPIASSFLELDYSIRVKERLTDTCPLVRFAHNHGSVYVDSDYYDRKYCHCDEHFYGNGGFCFPCMRGSFCPGSVRVEQQSIRPVNFKLINAMDIPVSKMFIRKGYYPFPSEKRVESVQHCPTSVYYNNICIPDVSCDCHIFSKENGTYSTERGVLHQRHSRIRCNESCLCLRGHYGRFCSRCKQGYYKEGIRCYECPHGSRKGLELGILFGSTLLTVFVSFMVFYVSMKRLKLSIGLAVAEIVLIFVLVLKGFVPAFLIQLVIIIYALGFSSYLKRCTALLKSAVFYIQIMDMLVSTTDIWPKSIYSAQMYASSALNFHFSSLACFLPKLFTPFAKNLTLFVLPILFVATLWCVYFLWQKLTRPNEEKLQSLNFKCRKYCIIFIDLAYFPIVGSSLSVIIGCREIDEVSFMKSYVWLDCNSTDHIALKVIAVLKIVFYLIGIPLFVYVPLLFLHRNQLSDDKSDVMRWLGPLTNPYKIKYRPYAEVIMITRRLLIAVLMTSFPANAAEQTQYIAMLLVSAIIYQTSAKPFRIPTEDSVNDRDKPGLDLENPVEISMLVSVLFSFLCVGLSIGHGRFSPWSPLFVLTLCINGLFLLAFICSILYRLRPVNVKEEAAAGNTSDLHEPLIDVNDCYVRQLSGDSYQCQ